jgi:undecaprenyl-diphosphatase
MALTWFDAFKSLVLGMVGGLTEFLPVSADGHLLVVRRLLGLEDSAFRHGFAVAIELGALLALLSVYLPRLLAMVRAAPGDPAVRRLVLGLAIASAPAAAVGALAHGLFPRTLNNIWITCFALIVGGALLLWIDQLKLDRPDRDTAFPLPVSLAIGMAQVLALVPGVSGPWVTIVAVRLLGGKPAAAADYALWLSIPMLCGTLAADALQGGLPTDIGGALLGALAFAAAFLTAWPMVRSFPDFVAQNGLRLFAWWRVIVGTLGLIVAG